MTEVDAVLNDMASPLVVSEEDGDVGRLLR